MIRRVHTFFFLFVFNCLAAIKDMIRRVRSARAESPYKQHALKGQKLLAQGVLRNSIRTGRFFPILYKFFLSL